MTARRILVVALAIVAGGPAAAQSPWSPVNHPAADPSLVRLPKNWRPPAGEFGEKLVRAAMECRGYQVHDMKLPGNQGIDQIAVRYSQTGQVVDVKLIEVKTHTGTGAARLSRTSHGLQMSPNWIKDRLRKLRASGPEGRRLVNEIYEFSKVMRLPVERLGEIHDINTRSMTYTVRDPATRAARHTRSVRDVLALVVRRGDARQSVWAALHLKHADAIRGQSIRSWAAEAKPAGRAFAALAQGRQALRAAARAARVLARLAGPIGAIVATAQDGYELYTSTMAYSRGDLTSREYTVVVTRTVVGFAAAGFGAAKGAGFGAMVGTLGGPVAWLTVPAGAIIGGTIGGVAGYFVGGYVSELAVVSYYDTLDGNVAEAVKRWMIDGPCPIAGD